jgi:hypothetical protein
MKNKIIVIGYLGIRKCYLNVPEEIAIARYCESEELTREEFDKDIGLNMQTIEFDDEFGCYDVWEDKWR